MFASCKICGKNCGGKVYSTVGDQKVCSLRCAASVSAQSNDRCANCGSPVWEDENYYVDGKLCCCISCRDQLRSQQYSRKGKDKGYKNPSSYKPSSNQFSVSPGMRVGGTNVAMGPREWDENEVDMGPGDSRGNYYHGNPNYGGNAVEEEEEEIVEEVEIKDTPEFEIKFENNMYIISGKVIEKVMRNVNFDDYESVQYFQRFLDMKGINKQLEKMGINEGDTVRIGEVEFEYIR